MVHRTRQDRAGDDYSDDSDALVHVVSQSVLASAGDGCAAIAQVVCAVGGCDDIVDACVDISGVRCDELCRVVEYEQSGIDKDGGVDPFTAGSISGVDV